MHVTGLNSAHRGWRFPEVALSAQYTETGTGQNAIQPPTVVLGVTAPLPLFYHQQGEIRRAEAAREAASDRGRPPRRPR
jgi:hypothetical protein